MRTELDLPLTNQILHAPAYLESMETLRRMEQDRIFCRHDLAHCLDVARLTLLLCRENGVRAEADIVYAAALLHDIGRVTEYADGTSHDEAGLSLACSVLSSLDCPPDRQAQILSLIASHREGGGGMLEQLFSLADKRSRQCFACPARGACNWEAEKQNMNIRG